MKFHFRTIFWVLFIVVLLILVAIAVVYMRNFTGLGPVPTRSSFLGRLPSIPEGNMRRFQFFYATNRVNNDETFNGRGNLLADHISTGTFDVLISPYLPIEPFAWFDTDHMKWSGQKELSQGQFQQDLRQAVQESPRKSLLIIVWGFRDWFQSAALKTAYSGYLLDIDTPVLLFDWPGNQGEGWSGYAASQRVATQSAPDLGRLLADVIGQTDAEDIWLMGSSLGCQTICDAFTWLHDQPELLQGKPKMAHVVFSAPDVSAEAFDEKFAERIKALAQHLTVYVSSNDRALLMSHWLNSGRRLGRKAAVSTPPESRKGQYEFEEALELMELMARERWNISIVDATPINRLRNLHHFFTDSPEFFDDLYQRLLQPDDIVSRRLHTVRAQRLGVTYWILWNN